VWVALLGLGAKVHREHSPKLGSPSPLEMPCAFHCLNFGLVKEWCRTCKEYHDIVKRPFQKIPLKNLFSCQQSDWGAAYAEWGVLQFYLGVVLAIVAGVTIVLHNPHDEWDFIIAAAIEIVVRVVVAYLMAHLSWFSVVHKDGCFCCIVACCECTPILLLWGLVGMLLGVGGLYYAVRLVLDDCLICIFEAVLQLTYSVILFYMGLCCFKLWWQGGGRGVSHDIEMTLPQGQVVGAPRGFEEGRTADVTAADHKGEGQIDNAEPAEPKREEGQITSNADNV